MHVLFGSYVGNSYLCPRILTNKRMKKLRTIIVGLLLSLLCLPVGAQDKEMRWENVTVLNYEMIANAKQMMKEHPELADDLKGQLKEMERMRGELNGHVDNEVKEYTYAPATILKKLTSLAVGKRTFTDRKDIGNGMFAVKTGACYGPIEPDAFERVKTLEENECTWGAIDYEGNFIIQPKYGEFRNSWAEADLIYKK